MGAASRGLTKSLLRVYNMWWTNFKYEDGYLVNTKNGKAIDAAQNAQEGYQV